MRVYVYVCMRVWVAVGADEDAEANPSQCTVMVADCFSPSPHEVTPELTVFNSMRLTGVPIEVPSAPSGPVRCVKVCTQVLVDLALLGPGDRRSPPEVKPSNRDPYAFQHGLGVFRADCLIS